MAESAIVVEHVSKRYRVQSGKQALLEALVQRLARKGRSVGEFAALEDVSFTVERGEALAVIGGNGAGKSTLLKILAGIAVPSTGRVDVNVRISTQLALGSGFHPYLSGRDNIFLQGSILGMTNMEVERLLPSIVEFAGLDGAIERPLWTYSTGMVGRLGFAVAAHVEFECLLLDEALGGGDLAFRDRCKETLTRYRDSGATLVIVSHGSDELRRLCDRALWLERGRVRMWGTLDDVLAEYEAWASGESPEAREATG